MTNCGRFFTIGSKSRTSYSVSFVFGCRCGLFAEKINVRFNLPHLVSARSFLNAVDISKMGSTGVESPPKMLTKTSSLGDLYQADPMAEQLFYQFADMDSDMKVPVGKFIKALVDAGLRKDDPRLSDFFANLRKEEKKGGHYQSLRLEKKTFVELVHNSIMIISRAVKREMVIPDFATFSRTIEELYEKCRENNEGERRRHVVFLSY